MQTIELSRHQGWTEIVLNRPEKRNAISPKMVDELTEVMSSPNPEPLVLSAAGPIFCAGADLTARGEPGHSPSLALLHLLLTTKSFVVAEVNKPALGAGVGLVMACPAVVCCEQAWFGLPEAKAGFFPSAMTAMLAASCPPRVIMELALGRSRLDALQAMQAGLVSEVAPEAELRPLVLARVKEAMSNPELHAAAREYWQQRVSLALSKYVE